MLDFSRPRLGEGFIKYLCVRDKLEVTDIWVCVIQASFEYPRPGMNSQVIGSLSPVTPGLGAADEEKSNDGSL